MEDTTPVVDAAPAEPATEAAAEPTGADAAAATTEEPDAAEQGAIAEATEAVKAFINRAEEEQSAKEDAAAARFKLFIAPIPRTATVDELKEIFKAAGEIIELTILTDKDTGAPRGCAFVTYGTKDEAEAAIEQFHLKLKLPGVSGDKASEIQYARTKSREELASDGGPDNRQLFFARATTGITDAVMKATFEAFGKVEIINIFKDKRTGNVKGCGFVTMKERAAAQRAIEVLDGKYIMPNGREKLTVKWADPDLQEKKKKRSHGEMQEEDNKQLFFGKATKTASEEDVKQLFSTYGTVQEVVVFKEKGTGNSKGCGFVTMATRAEAEAALQALAGSNYTMEGATEALVCNWAENASNKRGRNQGQYPGNQYGGWGQQDQWGQQQPFYQQPYGYPDQYGMYGQPQLDAYGNPMYMQPQYGQDPYGQYQQQPVFDPQSGQYMYQQQQPAQGYGGGRGGGGGGGGQRGAEHKLYVGGVPHHIEEHDLRPMFESCGTIVELKVLKDRNTGVHRGAAFLTFSSQSEADQAINTYHQKCTLPGNPRPLIVKYANRPQF